VLTVPYLTLLHLTLPYLTLPYLHVPHSRSLAIGLTVLPWKLTKPPDKHAIFVSPDPGFYDYLLNRTRILYVMYPVPYWPALQEAEPFELSIMSRLLNHSTANQCTEYQSCVQLEQIDSSHKVLSD
jgi:hypothetical protein